MLLSCPDSLSGLFFALLGVYLFFTSFAAKLHFFLGVFFHFITGADSAETVRDIVELCKELNEEMLLDSYSTQEQDADDQLELRKDTLVLETLLAKAEKVIPPTVRRYDVVVIEHRKKLVPVLAASWAEAEARVREMWENGEVVIGQSDFAGIMISSGG